jgi:hypothetical protein
MFPNFLFRLIMVIITTGLLLGSVLLVIRYYFSFLRKPAESPLRVEDHKIILPLRLQAYERIILFLERITPSSLVMRVNQPGFTAAQLQLGLVRTIREEFEYNLSQQLYISSTSWELVKNAKEETIKMINMASGRISETDPAGELVRIIFELSLENENPPVSTALDMVKREIQQVF